MAAPSAGGVRARKGAAAEVPQQQAEPMKMMEPPTSRDRAMGGLFASVALGCVALITICGGNSEYSGLSMAAVAVFIVGPVAYGGLVFSIKQVMAFLSKTKEGMQDVAKEPPAMKKKSVSSAPAAPQKAAVPKAAESEEKKTVSKEPEISKSKAAPQDKSAEVDPEDQPTALELILEFWASLPTAAGLVAKASAAKDDAPSAFAKVGPGVQSLWTWLTRQRWKPFPWVYLPDPIAFLWGVLEIAFIAPILAIEIMVTVPTMELLKAEWRQKRFAWLRETVPELVRSVSRPLGQLTMRDPRNHSYLPWMIMCGTITPALFVWAMRRHATYGLEFSTLVIYHLIRVGPRFQNFAHIHTLTHKEGHAHKGFFRGPFQFLNCTTEWFIGPFYGVVPWNYYVAHMKIHHRWHNDVDDVHTNLDLDRTNPLSFFLYVPRFTLYWTGLSPLALFIQRGEWSLIAKLLYGMVAYYGVALILFVWSPSFCMVYWLFPHVEACVLLCAISYLWHAFVEESDPGNQYVNSVTILDGHDNVWNEDYHVVHHHAPNTHWTDAPAHFVANKAHYAAVNATIFRNTEEGKLLQWLFESNFDAMAEHFVDLNGKLTLEEKKALIIRRLSVVCDEKGRDGKRKGWAADSTIREFQE